VVELVGLEELVVRRRGHEGQEHHQHDRRETADRDVHPRLTSPVASPPGGGGGGGVGRTDGTPVVDDGRSPGRTTSVAAVPRSGSTTSVAAVPRSGRTISVAAVPPPGVTGADG